MGKDCARQHYYNPDSKAFYVQCYNCKISKIAPKVSTIAPVCENVVKCVIIKKKKKNIEANLRQ